MVVDAQGRAYVGNFGFDFHGALDERGAASVFADHEAAKLALVEPDGTVRVAADDMHFPNGTVITPDGRTLIIAESLATRLTAFDIADDGSLSNRRVFAELGAVAPDGICLDADGNVWVANAVGPECVLVAPGGEVVDRVATTRPCYACMLGGDDRRTLFMLTAYESGEERPAEREGRIEVAAATTPGAGLP
jgi:sugar lactone lactonase YvrE